MSRLLRRLMRLLPKELRHGLIRHSLFLPAVGESKFTFKIAETKEELEGAYTLLHDSYVGAKLSKVQPSRLRCTLHSALPSTTVLVAKGGDRVVATVSLIRDSEVGLPSDAEYLIENNAFRGNGFRLVEVSALAVHPDYRNLRHLASIQLMVFLYRYASECMAADMLCCTVHPRAVDFYEAIWGFRQNGKIVQYGYVQGALAAHMTLDLREFRQEWLPGIYGNASPRRNLYEFVRRAEPAFDFPVRKSSVVLDPVMTPELLEYFFVRKTSLLSELPDRERELIFAAYSVHFDTNRAATRTYRYPTNLGGHIQEGPARSSPGVIRDLSTGGAFFETDQLLEIGRVYEISLRLSETEQIKARATVRWRNGDTHQDRTSLRHPKGYGLSFAASDIRILRHLREAHRHIARSMPRKIQRASAS